MFGKLFCWITGKHPRGKRVGQLEKDGNVVEAIIQCPRCKAKWYRKVTAKERP